MNIYDYVGEAPFLVLIHRMHLPPVRGHFREVQRLRQVDETEEVLTQAGASPSAWGIEELRPNACIQLNALLHLIDRGSDFLTQGGNTIYGTHSLCQECIWY